MTTDEPEETAEVAKTAEKTFLSVLRVLGGFFFVVT
jgi:hypothetical protein